MLHNAVSIKPIFTNRLVRLLHAIQHPITISRNRGDELTRSISNQLLCALQHRLGALLGSFGTILGSLSIIHQVINTIQLIQRLLGRLQSILGILPYILHPLSHTQRLIHGLHSHRARLPLQLHPLIHITRQQHIQRPVRVNTPIHGRQLPQRRNTPFKQTYLFTGISRKPYLILPAPLRQRRNRNQHRVTRSISLTQCQLDIKIQPIAMHRSCKSHPIQPGSIAGLCVHEPKRTLPPSTRQHAQIT